MFLGKNRVVALNEYIKTVLFPSFSLYYAWTAIFLSHVSVHVPQNSKRLRSTAIYGLSGGLAAILRVEFIIFLFYFFLNFKKVSFLP